MNEVDDQITRIENLNKIARELLEDQKALEARLDSRDEVKLRDQFAGLAMQGFCSREDPWSPNIVASEAYRYADAMIQARQFLP